MVASSGSSLLVDRGAALRLAQISLNASVREALASLDASGCQVVLAIDPSKQVVGLVTDGDVRRALLKGATLTDPVRPILREDFAFVAPGTLRVDVLDLMQSRRISEVPVLDANRRLVGLHLLHDVLRHDERPNAALIMAGGRGTRLAPITDTLPKPMVRVAGRPILERLILHLVGTGIRQIFISVQYLAHVIEEHFGDGRHFGCRIEYMREDVPLGTGGALSLLPDVPTWPMLVINGDLVTQADIGALLDFHTAHRHVATIAVRQYFHTVPFGCLEIEDARVVGFDEKPTLQRMVNAGIYVIDPALVATVPRDSAISMPELISRAMQTGASIGAWEIEDDWLDVGQHDQLERARGGR